LREDRAGRQVGRINQGLEVVSGDLMFVRHDAGRCRSRVLIYRSVWFLMNSGNWPPRCCRRSLFVRKVVGPLL
ncbi:hypothetical protein, partial [Streptomyces sp. NRRL S-1448]|uniref:hypothetical protein n=1 Tax=Streptomyces sp. NRRL S-1448 TaxID=1463883 RepID=UPI001F34CCC0